MFPFYLQAKLVSVGINTLADLKQHGYIRVFQYLRDLYPSISYNALFDLYAFCTNSNRNSINSILQKQLISEYKAALPHYAPLNAEILHKFLSAAELEAQAAAAHGEIPIGAVVVKDNQVIGRGFNHTITHNNILQHAEIVALQDAAQTLSTHRLDNCDLYVTVEPCAMCVGAIMHSRIRRLIFAALSPDNGAVVSQYSLLQNAHVNKHVEAICPIAGNNTADVLQKFLRAKR